MTSQFWANVYLNPLDHLLKTEIISQEWLRYFDDIVVFSTSKKDLNCVREKTIDFLSDLRMTIHEGSAQPTPTSQGLTFLGFRLFPDYIRLKRKKLVNGYRKLKGSYQRLRENRCTQDHYTNQLKGWLSHVRQGNTWQLRRTVLQKLGISATQGSNFERIANFVKTYDLLLWIQNHTGHYPKHERFRLAKESRIQLSNFMVRSYALL